MERVIFTFDPRLFKPICRFDKLTESVKNTPAKYLSQPVIKQQMGPAHWEKLEAINSALTAEYKTRRFMLLKRVDVTLASFNWSDRAKVR